MKSVRFSRIVEASGAPEEHLVLTDPSRDKTLRAAMKACRLMTVFQDARGSNADHGEVGFKVGPARQYLLFPKSLHRFEGRKVVGINYELLERGRIRARGEKILPVRKHTPTLGHPPRRKSGRKGAPLSDKIVAFEPEESPLEDEQITELKRQVQRAMAHLEKGKAVAALNLLKRILSD